MADFHVDQAAGLRRLFGNAGLQVVAFVAGGEGLGRSAVVANIGAAVARQGKEVLLFDENSGSDDLAGCFGLSAGGDLQDVLDGRASMSEILVEVAPGLRILPAARTVQRLGTLSARHQQALLTAMQIPERPADVILVDACSRHPAGISPLALAAHETVVLLSASGSSITEAYALIKKGSQAFGRRQYRILVNRARHASDARSIFDNIAEVAAQRRIASIDYAGAVPLDPALRHAARVGQAVVVACPESPAASAVRDIAADLLRWRRAPGDGADVKQFFQQLLHLSQRLTPCALRAG